MMANNDNVQEVEYEEIDAPDCFPWHDDLDPSCTRCKVRRECIEEQETIRPDCFGVLHDSESGECMACIRESQCVEKKENDKVAKRKIRRKRQPVRPPVVAEEEVVEEEVVETPKPARVVRARKVAPEPKEEAADQDKDYGQWNIPDLRAELEDRGLEVAGRKSVLIGRLLSDDAGEEAPAPKRVARHKKEAVEAEPVEGTLEDLFDAMQEGQAVLVTRTGRRTWQFTLGGVAVVVAKPRGNGLRGRAWDKEVYTPEYYAFRFEDAGKGKAWDKMTDEEKYAFGDALNVSWNRQDNARVDMMRMLVVIYKELDISKFKPEYRGKAGVEARNALR